MMVLRKANLDARDRAILCAVWCAWADGKPSWTWQELMQVSGSKSTSTITSRINGLDSRNHPRRHNGNLVANKWLCFAGRYAKRTLTPGPRLAGIDSDGHPLEIVEV